MLVHEVMSTRPVTVRPGTTVVEALRLLDRYSVTSLPVVDGRGRIRGVVSEADLIRDRVPTDPRVNMIPIAHGVPDRPELVEEVMTPLAVAVTPETDLAVAVELTTSTGVKSLPVVDVDRQVVGIVSRSDIVHAIVRADDDLERRIDELLRSVGMSDWLVDVNAGVVQLSGPDASPDAVAARMLARTVPGVIEVQVPVSARRRGGLR